MRVSVGTSGFQYKFWRGNFYPQKCREADMLATYGAKLPTVEINSTFYSRPKPAALERWAREVPASFRFAIKASRWITHIKRLKDAEQPVASLFEDLKPLGSRLGIVLFQLPPSFKRDMARLQQFLAAVPKGKQAALEFRHETWFSDEVYAALRARDVAMCISDEGEGEKATPFVVTAGYGYLRMRKEKYSGKQLAAVANKVRAASWDEAYVYFKHEQDAPKLATRLQKLF